MHIVKNKEGEDAMLTMMKPIQATPELSGEDAQRVIEQVNKIPTEEAIKKNKKLLNVLHQIRKN